MQARLRLFWGIAKFESKVLKADVSAGYEVIN